ncbi:hypothetical protein B0H14DRAFT_2696907 [Mycena olivaceomarginata]|nr:hypothetical protein B0H14DRAFT_2696907 [Mycena olivaceomarginata]
MFRSTLIAPCGAMCTLLAYPGFSPYISKLRRLSFIYDPYDRTQPLVAPAANTLEHIHSVRPTSSDQSNTFQIILCMRQSLFHLCLSYAPWSLK